MSVSFEGVGQVCATFLGGNLAEGQVVKMKSGGTVAACSADDPFCGVALCCKDDACTIFDRRVQRGRSCGGLVFPGRRWEGRRKDRRQRRDALPGCGYGYHGENRDDHALKEDMEYVLQLR